MPWHAMSDNGPMRTHVNVRAYVPKLNPVELSVADASEPPVGR